MSTRRWRETKRVYPKLFTVFKTDPTRTPEGANIWAVGMHRRQAGDTAQDDSMVLQSLTGRQAWNEAGSTFAWGNTHLLEERLRWCADAIMRDWVDEMVTDYGAMRMDGQFQVCSAFTRNTVHQSTVLLHRDDTGEADLGIDRYELWHRATDDALWALGCTAHVVHTLKDPVGVWTIGDGARIGRQQISFRTGKKRVVDIRRRQRELADHGFRRFASIDVKAEPGEPHVLDVPGDLVLPDPIARLQGELRDTPLRPPAPPPLVVQSGHLTPIGF